MRAPIDGDSDLERTASEESEQGDAPVRARRKRGAVLAGKYRLEMLLGEGGMASVWSAYHLELELPVAVKLLRGGTSNARLVERLRLEARAGAHLVHPSTVRIFDIATTDDGEPFIVMELLTGESLAHALSRGRLSGARAVQLMLPIAEALALAHAHGIVHRDLKPDNVFLANEGDQIQPKLLDFGIAKATRGTLDKLTQRGTVLGSPYYMSPEQVRGDDVDFHTDIWSFCVVLYRSIVGRAPFRGSDKRAVLEAIAGDEPARVPSGVGMDERLARLVCWGLTKDPARRPSSIRELGRQLAKWLISQGISEDASGAPIAAKWLARVAEPSLRRPPPYAEMREPAKSERGATLATTAPLDPITERIAVRTLERLARPRARRWALLAAASLLIVSASVARTDSRQTSPVASRTAQALARQPALTPTPRSLTLAEGAPQASAANPAPSAEAASEALDLAIEGGAEPQPRPAPAQRRRQRGKPAPSTTPQLPF